MSGRPVGSTLRGGAASRAISAAAAIAVGFTGALALAGWALGIEALKSVVPGFATMKPNTGLAFLLSGASLWLFGRRRAFTAARVLAVAVALIGLLTLIEYVLGWDLGIDRILLSDSELSGAGSPAGRMALATALSFLLVGLALLLLDAPGGAPADYPAVTAGLISLIAFIGYLYGVNSLYSIGPFSSVALHTACALGVLCIGILAARPERGFVAALTSPQPGGALARRLLLPAMVVPLLLGWLRLRGEELGLYEGEFGVALFATSLIVVFVVLVMRAARSLDEADTADAAERKRAEEARQRVRELEELNRQALEANRLKSEFLANMSHELRTPLNAIVGFTELIVDGKAGPVNEQQREFLGYTLASSNHLLQLINDVLDLARIEAGRMELVPEPVDPASALREVEDILSALAVKKRIQVTSETDPELREVVVDSRRLKQVLYNYLSNALKFTPDEGRVTVRIRAEEPHRFRLEVEDTGIGIAPEDLPRLFTNFHQLDAGLARQHGGTGLGLALTRRLVEEQGGRVGVESTLGQGSLFYAVLPRVARKAGP